MPCSFLNSSSIQLQDRVVEVVAAEVGVSVGGEHFEDAVADLEDRDVKCSAA